MKQEQSSRSQWREGPALLPVCQVKNLWSKYAEQKRSFLTGSTSPREIKHLVRPEIPCQNPRGFGRFLVVAHTALVEAHKTIQFIGDEAFVAEDAPPMLH